MNNIKTTTEYLKYTFSDDELKEKAAQLAMECKEEREIEDEKKQAMSLFKSKLDSHAANIAKLASYINNGYEYRYIECEIMFDFPLAGRKTFFRKDTGKIAKEEDMTETEMQCELPLEENAETSREISEFGTDIQ
jgi:hypothetical protein